MCPGQGAQKVGMGKDLAERFPAARHTFEAIDEALGVPLSRLMCVDQGNSRCRRSRRVRPDESDMQRFI